MATTINKTDNTVTVTSAEHDITVTNNNTGTSVSIDGNQVTSVTVGVAGVQGATGPQGAPGSVEDTIAADNIIQPFTHVTASGNISASGTIVASNLSGTNTGDQTNITGNAGTADQVDTILSEADTKNYITFVDSNNSTATPETVHTNKFLYVNPRRNELIVQGKLFVSGSSITLESGSISASNNIFAAGNITASGNISSSGTIVASSFTGDGSGLTGVTSYTNADTLTFINSVNTISSSAQIATDISGSFTSLSSSLEVRLASVEAGSTSKTLLSGSAQIATEISGAFVATSASLASAIATNLSRNTELTAATSSYALKTNISGSLGPNATLIRSLTAAGISGSFTNASASFSTRVTANDAKVGYTDSLVKTKLDAEGVVSSSAQIELSDFNTDNLSEGSSNLYYTDARVKTKLNTENVISSSAQIATEVSGALGANATLIRSLTATSISESFVAPSSSFSTRVTTLEGNVGQAVNTDSNVTFATISATSLTVTSVTSSFITSSVIETSGSNIFGDEASDSHTFVGSITASGNISASGNIILSQSLSFGTAPDVNNPNVIESNHLKISAGTNDYALFTDNYVQIYADGSNTFQVTGGGQKAIGLNPNKLDVDVTINTDKATAFQSIGSNDIVRIGGTVNYFETASLVEHNADTFFRQGVTINNVTTSGSSGLIISGSGGHIYTTGHITASGNISASGVITTGGYISASQLVTSTISHIENGDDRITFENNFINFVAGSGGSQKNFFRIDDNADIVLVNYASVDIDFQINTDNSRALFVDAGNDRVHVGNTYDNFNPLSRFHSTAEQNRFTSTVNIANYGWDSSLNESFPQFAKQSGSLLRVFGHTPTTSHNLVSASIHVSSSIGTTFIDDGDISLSGHITASGNISASGDIIGGNDLTIIKQDGTPVVFTLNSPNDGFGRPFTITNDGAQPTINAQDILRLHADDGDAEIKLDPSGQDKITFSTSGTERYKIDHLGNHFFSSNISASGYVSASAFVGDGSGLTGLTAAAITSTANGADNRIATYTDADSLNGEANLTFDGTSLNVTGNVTASGAISASGGLVGTLTGTATSASRSDAANKVYTSQDNSDAEHFVTFVDSNNAVHADEDVHTTNFLRVNPQQRILIVEGAVKIPGSDITLESGSISASRDIFAPAITASGTISSSGDIHSATIRYVANIHDSSNNRMISGTATALELGDVSAAGNRTRIQINDSARGFTFTSNETTEQSYNMPGVVTTTMIRTKKLRGQSPLIIDPTSVIISASQQFALGVGGVTSSLFMTASITGSNGRPRIGFNTREPQTDFDVSAREVQFQKPGTRQGLKINEEGNIESFNKDANSASTGSEVILKYSRGASITKASMDALFGAGTFADDSAATTFFNAQSADKQSSILEKLENLGFITLPTVGDTIGSIRFVAESGSAGFDERVAGEAASIKSVIHTAGATGIRGDLIFSVADVTGTSNQRFLLDAGDNHQITGSLTIGGSSTTAGDITLEGPTGNHMGGIFRYGSNSADQKIGRLLLYDDGTQKIRLSSKGFSFITATSDGVSNNTRLGIGTQSPGDDYMLDIAGVTNIQNNLIVTGSITAASINLIDTNTDMEIGRDLLPSADTVGTLGTATRRFEDVFSVQTTTGGVFEVGLRTKDIGKLETGTIVSWKDGKCIPCYKSEDNMVMGVIKQGKDEPIVLGAEPVLVTGKVEEGDYIVTSEVVGHGKAAKEGYIFKKNLFGRVIAQALESAEGDSSLIKCMIRKM